MSQSARRRFLAAVCASALVDPLAFLTPVFAQAKAPEKVKRIGFLWVASQADQTKDISAFEQKLRELGHVQGRDNKLEYRFASGRNELLPDQAVDLVRSKVDVIVAATNPAIIAAKPATTSISIVMVVANDPVRAGFVASLAHPGGNITGLTFDVGDDIWGKRLELLKEAAPKMVRVGVIWNPDYCAGAVLLNRLTGLDDRIEVHKGSALEVPFPDDSFDAVWMQNVGMNIADKRKLYAEVYRVLKPDGRFAFQEMAAGKAVTSYFPLPWATDPADSFLVSAEEIRSALAESGFVAELFEDTSDAHLSRTTADGAPSPLTLAVYVDNLAQKAGNARRSLQEGQIRLVRGVFRVK